ncbi:hypothetical protein OESDEN_05495 [Oesophagostomum dentatum]|uniref:Peptidase M12B domain-containing protein n=1 Tax=Oesophagostomum dentatum TaxID=61180 RepID=A0A0B1TEP1_OESDE|nr:hypothetical protein OESDEN_05495 [Oesophagostomum dentatum]
MLVYRSFHLILVPLDEFNEHFHPDHILDENGRYEEIQPHTFLFEGYVKDDPGSKVYGSILDGVFDGHIRLGDGNSFTVDRATKYFDYLSRPSHYHSIIYHDAEINHSKMRTKRSAYSPHDDSSHGCGLSDRVKREMERIQRSAEMPSEVYTNYMTMHGRSKRATRDENGLYTVRTCSLYLQADHKLYEHIKRKEGNNDPIRTREEIVGLFYNHIKAVNEIYEGTNFNGIKGLHFVIQRTSIYTPETCDKGRPVAGSDNPFCEENVDVSNFLNLNSQRNHSAFCLAYALTFRDFVGGTLGLAWVASPQYNTAGGICQVYQRYNEGSRGWVFRSLNTGIVTLVNYGNRVPTRVSQLTLAHEIGHNFGSPHDYPLGLPDGNFIMFASATSGDKVNNAKFSPCSIANISSVLHVVLQSVPIDPTRHSGPVGALMKRNCFQGQCPSTRNKRQRRHRSRAPVAVATSGGGQPRPNAQAPPSASRAAARASAPPLPPAAPVPVPLIQAGSAPPQPAAVLVVEPPPPYTAAADPGSALGGPRRGHRRNKRQTSADAAPKSRGKAK